MIVIRNPALRRFLRSALPFAAIPATVAAGALLLREKGYLAISLLVAGLSLLLFAAGYERRKTGSRRMVLTAVMTALCIAGRFIPFFKPITALTILTAMYLGPESGFLTGAMAALASNFWFGQGPWTPFQMLAWGMIGLVSGYLHPLLKRSRVLLLGWGALSGIAYSLVMDVWTVLWYEGSFSPGLYGASVIAALPHTTLYTLSNLVFLYLLARPIGEKLERVRVKYGL